MNRNHSINTNRMSGVLVIAVVIGVLMWFMTGTTGAMQAVTAVLSAIIAGVFALAGLKVFEE